MMSAQEGEVLEALAWLLRSLHERVAALEERQPTWASCNLPLADVAARLERLERAAAAINGNVPPSPAGPPGPAPDAQRMAHGGALRTAIANVIETEPAATGPRVIEALRATHVGKLPSLRTCDGIWQLCAATAAMATAMPHE
jgi:hypothetical protein